MLTPRKAEVEAVVDLLEGGEHDTPEALAKDLIKLVAGMLSDRDSFGVAIGLQSDDLRLPHGPYFGKAEAEKVAREARQRGLVAFVAPLIAPARALSEDADPHKPCATCKHEKWQHWDQGRCAIFHRNYTGPKARQRPNLPSCGCTGYIARG